MSITRKEILANQKKLGKRVKQLRLERDMSQMDLSVHCDLEKSNLSKIENGRANLTLRTMSMLAKALEVELEELFNFRL